MKVAVVTDDEKTISQHFGRAKKYLVVEIIDGQVMGRETRQKPGHKYHHNHDHDHEHEHEHSGDHHSQMAAAVQDCEIVLARGMGAGAKHNLKKVGAQIYQVDLHEIDEAIDLLIRGEIEGHIFEQSCGDHAHH